MMGCYLQKNILSANFSSSASLSSVAETSRMAAALNRKWSLMTSSAKWHKFYDKIVIVELDFFPKIARLNGQVIERLLRDYLGTVGLSHVTGCRESDLFVLTDADEIPTSETIDFLRWHDGYTQPVSFAYRYSFIEVLVE